MNTDTMLLDAVLGASGASQKAAQAHDSRRPRDERMRMLREAASAAHVAAARMNAVAMLWARGEETTT